MFLIMCTSNTHNIVVDLYSYHILFYSIFLLCAHQTDNIVIDFISESHFILSNYIPYYLCILFLSSNFGSKCGLPLKIKNLIPTLEKKNLIPRNP